MMIRKEYIRNVYSFFWWDLFKISDKCDEPVTKVISINKSINEIIKVIKSPKQIKVYNPY